MPSTKFYGSQIGGPRIQPHSYTGTPLQLLRFDIVSAFSFILYLPYIVFPIRPFDSNELCELYPSPANLWAIFLHVILVILQLPFILSIPFWFVLPLWAVALGVGAFMLVNMFISYLLNGGQMEFSSNPKYAKVVKEHEHEQWIFLNGVAVGKHWMQSNIDRLALTFGRPILGVHNKTAGILFDVIQCLIQRNFNYATNDVRECYAIVKSTLYQPHLTKVVFILHSQGAIEGGMIIDWLLQEVPQDLLAKLEVYTFGNAANHFNNPHLHLLSQAAALKNPHKPSTTKTTTHVHYHDPLSPVDIDDPRSPAIRSRSTKQQSTEGKTIRYIEHYAHTKDFVAQWGVLHFVSASFLNPFSSRFMGRVFERQGKGHQMNQHYLDSMFPLKPANKPGGGIAGSGFEGANEQGGDFMNSEIDLTPDSVGGNASGTGNAELGSGTEPSSSSGSGEEREGLETSYVGAHGEPLSGGETDVLIRDMSPNSTFNIVRDGFAQNSNISRNINNANINNDESARVLANGDGNGRTNDEGSTGMDARATASASTAVRADTSLGTVSFKVKDMSRLWLYINGRSPKADETDVSLARMSTI